MKKEWGISVMHKKIITLLLFSHYFSKNLSYNFWMNSSIAFALKVSTYFYNLYKCKMTNISKFKNC